MEPKSLASPALTGGFFTTSTTWEAQILKCLKLNKKFNVGCEAYNTS